MNKTILFVLQNAYRSDKYNFKNEEEWHRDLHRSYTGKRLMEMIPDNVTYFVINASQDIGGNADSCFPPNPEYIKRKVNEIKPDLVCACGTIAAIGVNKANLKQNPVILPHPAWRCLSKEKTQEIREVLKSLLINQK